MECKTPRAIIYLLELLDGTLVDTTALIDQMSLEMLAYLVRSSGFLISYQWW